jgi:hypothetical protein
MTHHFYKLEVLHIPSRERFRFKNKDEIITTFGISRSSIRTIKLGLHRSKGVASKWLDYEITDIKIPVE